MSLLGAACVVTALGGTAAQAAPVPPSVTADDLVPLNGIVDHAPQRYAGLVVDQEKKTVNVYVRSGEQSAAASDLAALPAPAGSGPRLVVKVVPVQRSAAELATVFHQIDTRQSWTRAVGDRLSSWYIDPAANKVTVGVTAVTDAVRARARAEFGDAVQVVAMPRYQAMAAAVTVPTAKVKVASGPSSRTSLLATAPTRLLDSTPYYGGDRIIRWRNNPDNTTTIWWCTGAFTVKAGTTFYMSTAGHCGPTGTAWQQGYYESGAQLIHTTGPMGTASSVQWGNNRMDAAILGGGSYWQGAVYGGQVAGSAWGVGGQSSVAVGSSICSDGSVTGENCSAKISAINACVNLQDDTSGTTITVKVCNQALADSTSGVIVQHGDSGGPVLQHTSVLDQVVGVGLVSGGSSNGLHLNFTQIQNFTSTFGVSVTTGVPCC